MEIYRKGNNNVMLKCTAISSSNIYLLFPHKELAQNAQRHGFNASAAGLLNASTL